MPTIAPDLTPRQRFVVFVERDDLHLPDSARIPDGVENRWTVVAPQSDEGGDVGMADQHLRHVRLGSNRIGIVGAHVDDRDRGAGDRCLDALQPLLGVARVQLAHENRDSAPLGQCLLDQVSRLAPGGHVVGADVTLALAVGGVAVVREDQRLFRRVVQHRRLIRRIHGADGDAVHAFRQQVVQDPLLRGGGSIAETELDFDVGQRGVRLLRALPGDRPEIGGVVGDEGDSLRRGRLAYAAAEGEQPHATDNGDSFQRHSILLVRDGKRKPGHH